MASIVASDAVLGHYSEGEHSLEPLLSESTQLFKNVVSDAVTQVESEVEADSTKLDQFYLVLHWTSSTSKTSPASSKDDSSSNPSKPSVSVKHRTLVQIAAYHGSLRVLAYLLSKGANPMKSAPDGATAYDMARAGGSPNASTAIAVLKDAEGPISPKEMPAGLQANRMRLPADQAENRRFSLDGPMALHEGERDIYQGNNSTYSAAELTREEYSTDNFRMYCFKVLRCSKRYAHDWRECPFAHPTENARRRDPREHRYCAIACPDYKQGFCIRGDACPYAHGVFECWLHPSRYRSQLCKDGSNCHRPVCFFAHTLSELRTPTHTWLPGPEDIANATQTTTPGNLSLNHVLPSMVNSLSDAGDASISAWADGSHRGSLSNSSVSAEGEDCQPSSSTTDASNHTQGSLGGKSSMSGSSGNLATPPVFGFTAPRMSNAFARRHGLNPKDNPMINLQKIALQNQMLNPTMTHDAANVMMRAANSGKVPKSVSTPPPYTTNAAGMQAMQGHNPMMAAHPGYAFAHIPQPAGYAMQAGIQAYAADPSQMLAAQLASMNLMGHQAAAGGGMMAPGYGYAGMQALPPYDAHLMQLNAPQV